MFYEYSIKRSCAKLKYVHRAGQVIGLVNNN